MHSHFAAFSALASLRRATGELQLCSGSADRPENTIYGAQERREMPQCSGARTTRWSDTGPFAEQKHRFLEPKYSGSVAFACA